MTRDLQINRMQKALYCLRRFSGLGMRELGNKLGVYIQLGNWTCSITASSLHGDYAGIANPHQ